MTFTKFIEHYMIRLFVSQNGEVDLFIDDKYRHEIKPYELPEGIKTRLYDWVASTKQEYLDYLDDMKRMNS